RAVPTGELTPDRVLRWGLLCTENTAQDGLAVGGNPLDQALWDCPAAASQRAALAGYTRCGVLPFEPTAVKWITRFGIIVAVALVAVGVSALVRRSQQH
ncbi:MAG: hypothetical protein WCG47_08080, partial [Dermatophilaceae bacterium]